DRWALAQTSRPAEFGRNNRWTRKVHLAQEAYFSCKQTTRSSGGSSSSSGDAISCGKCFAVTAAAVWRPPKHTRLPNLEMPTYKVCGDLLLVGTIPPALGLRHWPGQIKRDRVRRQ